MKFIGRDEEIKKIKEMYKSAAFEALLLYGRRRIGKRRRKKKRSNQPSEITKTGSTE